MKPFITSLTPRDLEAVLNSRTRVAPALRAIYSGDELELPSEAPGVATQAWRELTTSFSLPRYEISRRLVSRDGTRRLVLCLEDAIVETVLIPEEKRHTVCVSSQSGCSRRCRFCATSRLGFIRNLSAGEIVMQLLVARHEASAAGLLEPTNIVFMGMGEPLDNLEEVLRATEVLTALPVPGIAPRKITVSTSGVLPAIGPFLERSKATLALSLHATTDEQRELLVPHNRSWPIADLLDGIRNKLVGRRRVVLVEYLLIHQLNDRDADAWRLARLLDGLPCRVNLIPYNEVEGLAWREPEPQQVSRFMELLSRAKVRTMLRRPRGRDVSAACGQLAGGVVQRRSYDCA